MTAVDLLCIFTKNLNIQYYNRLGHEQGAVLQKMEIPESCPMWDLKLSRSLGLLFTWKIQFHILTYNARIINFPICLQYRLTFKFLIAKYNDRRISLRIGEIGDSVKRLGGIQVRSGKCSLIQMKDCPKFCRTNHGHSRQVCLGELGHYGKAVMILLPAWLEKQPVYGMCTISFSNIKKKNPIYTFSKHFSLDNNWSH